MKKYLCHLCNSLYAEYITPQCSFQAESQNLRGKKKGKRQHHRLESIHFVESNDL